MSETRKTASSTTDDTAEGFTAEERAAMKERASEVRKARGASRSAKADPEEDLLAKIAEMDAPDRAIAERLHALIREHAPQLSPKTWYGMPAYARDGKVVCFFQAASKFKTRYATFGFNDSANLDDGDLWPTAYALTALTDEVEAKLIELVTPARRAEHSVPPDSTAVSGSEAVPDLPQAVGSAVERLRDGERLIVGQ